jgi:hypothetical protein
MPDHRDPLDVEDAEQVSHSVGIRGDGVVGARLVGSSVSEQVGGDDGESLCERGLHRAPRGVVVPDSVDQQYRGTRPGDSERAAVSVDGAKLQRRRQFSHRAQIRLSRFQFANFVVGLGDRLIAFVPVLEAFFSLVPGR